MIGFDKLPINASLLLGLTLEEAIGTLTHDRAKPYHPMTLTGPPTWTQLANGLMVLDFDMWAANFLECPAALTTDLDFISEDFSVAVWINPETTNAARRLILRGDEWLGDGWDFHLWADNGFGIDTYTATAARYTHSAAGEISAGTWVLLGATRTGAACRVYKNGVDATEFADAHLNPTTADMKLHIGIENAEADNAFNGKMWYPRIWGGRKLEAEDMAYIFRTERHLFGV